MIHVDEHLLLKEIEMSDAAAVFKTIDTQREYLGKWLPFVAFTQKLEDSEKFVQSILDIPSEYREYVFAMVYDGLFAGIIGFKDTDHQNKKTEIGYWLSEKYQKKGVVTKSVKSLMTFAFEELGMNRIQIKCATGNIPSKNIPKRLKFKFEGIERDGELLTGNIYTDIEIYSRLKNDA
ncbi:MAG: GNAT family N-acetyltransferase [Bacteroidales bacterium]|nr:GNAT family N-acetyltransferase [Bacteroidales bacterium]